jgi:hypothetical protein
MEVDYGRAKYLIGITFNICNHFKKKKKEKKEKKETEIFTFAARKLPLATPAASSCQRLFVPCLRRLSIGGPGESFASMMSRMLPEASIAASSESESVTLYRPTYFPFFPVVKH